MRCVLADPNGSAYMEWSLVPVTAETEDDDRLMRTFADELSDVHGAPARRPAPVEA